jgi:hypothetical protein
MGDPRNVAHAKKVVQEKHHKRKDNAKDTPGTSQPVKKLKSGGQTQTVAPEASVNHGDATKVKERPDPTQLEKSLGVLAKLREMEFHSRTNIEKLAELSLTIEDELKQTAFVEAIGAVYSTQESFHSKLAELIESYQAECDRLKPAE